MKLLLLLLGIGIIPFPNFVVEKHGTCKHIENLEVVENASLEEEEYILDIRRRGIKISAGSDKGVFYARQTLSQLEREQGNDLHCLHIEDKPRFKHRGAELDCSRHFFSIEEVKRFIDVMAHYKLNRFHWHLTDDHGWRVEIKKYPLLTEVGAYRNGTMRSKCQNET